MGSRGAWCGVEGCELPKDKERKAGLCAEHTQEWLSSTEFREGTKDEEVRFAFALSKDLGVRQMNRFKRKWLKRLERAANDHEESTYGK